MKKTYRVTVEGAFTFPIDMLRYDAAYPASERDSACITAEGKRQVTVRMPNAPTEGRWNSFAWKVVKVEKV